MHKHKCSFKVLKETRLFLLLYCTQLLYLLRVMIHILFTPVELVNLYRFLFNPIINITILSTTNNLPCQLVSNFVYLNFFICLRVKRTGGIL